LIQSVSIDGEETELKQEFFWYAGNNRGNMRPPNNEEGSAKASGAYLFRPNQSDPFPVRSNEEVATTIYKGTSHIRIRFCIRLTNKTVLYRRIGAGNSPVL